MTIALTKLGVLGGIGSGKSAVCRMLAAMGAVVIDADMIAARVVEEPEMVAALASAFGPGVIGVDGRVDRAGLARAAFGSEASARKLDAVTHPRILDRMMAEERTAVASGADLIVIDAPLLFEAGLAARCDLLLFVDAPADLRRSRAAARGLPPEEWERRERAQGDLDEKRRASGFVIDNSGPVEETRAQVEAFFSRRLAPRLKGRAGGGPAMR